MLGRFTDLTLAFPQTLMVLALYSLGLAFITNTLHVPKPATSRTPSTSRPSWVCSAGRGSAV